VPIILTISCAKDRVAVQQAVRDTWRPWWPFEHKFLLGRGNTDPQVDEWIVDADDDYNGLQAKLREAYKRDHVDGDFTFVCCTDTYISPSRLLQTGYRNYDFSGARCTNEPHASGGNGYWLSQRARATIAPYPVIPGLYADQADSHILGISGIPLHDDQRYGLSVTKHLSKGTGVYDPAWMYQAHKRFLEQPL
jgi:hypothetical protein